MPVLLQAPILDQLATQYTGVLFVKIDASVHSVRPLGSRVSNALLLGRVNAVSLYSCAVVVPGATDRRAGARNQCFPNDARLPQAGAAHCDPWCASSEAGTGVCVCVCARVTWPHAVAG